MQHDQPRRQRRDNERLAGLCGFRPLPSGVQCPDCGAEWEPICSTRGCVARETVLRMLGVEGRGRRAKHRRSA